MTTDPETLHNLAVAAGASVLGDGPEYHYILSQDQLRDFLVAATLPPCPVPLPLGVLDVISAK